MLIIFIRAIVLFTVLLIVMRLMGKRQIGEMEPYELAITLVIAELACIPMQDKSVPLTYGIVSILALYVIHQIIMFVSKNIKAQTLISGKPIVVINKNGIDYSALQSMNMQTNDLLQSMRVAGYFNIDEIDFALYETNGKLSVIAKQSAADKQKTLPYSIVMDGEYNEEEVKNNNIDKVLIDRQLQNHNYKLKNIVLVTVDDSGKMLIQPRNKPYEIIQLPSKEIRNG